jgi:HSP20 family molecular chaperone IbpA
MKMGIVIEIDLPGFGKEDIKFRIIGSNILSIKASRKQTVEEQESLPHIHLRQRPVQIEKKLVLSISTSEVERVIGAANYTYGVVTLRIPFPEARTIFVT